MKRLGWFLGFMLLFATPAHADESLDILKDRLQSTQRQVSLDRHSNQLAREQLSRVVAQSEQENEYYKTHEISQSILGHTEIELAAAKNRIQEIDIILGTESLQFADTEGRIDELVKYQQQQALTASKRPDGKQKMADIQSRLSVLLQLREMERERLAVLQEGHDIAQQRLSLIQAVGVTQNRISHRQEQNRLLESSVKQMAAFQTDLENWFVTLENLQTQLTSLLKNPDFLPKQQRDLQIQILAAEEHVALLRVKITLLRTDSQIEKMRVPVRKMHSISQLNTLERNAKKILFQLEEIKHFVVAKNQYLEWKQSELEQDREQEEFKVILPFLDEIKSEYSGIHFKVAELEERTNLFEKEIRRSLKQELAVRQTLPPLTLSAWLNLGLEVFASLTMALSSLSGLFSQLMGAFKSLDIGKTVFCVILFAFFCLSWFLLRRLLMGWSTKLRGKRERFSSNVLYAICEVTSRTLLSLMLLVVAGVFSTVSSIPMSLFLYLLLVYIAVKWTVNIVRIVFANSADPYLYQRLKWIVLLGGILSTFVVITHLLPVDYDVKALSNRVFMLFILVLGLFLFKGRQILPNLFEAMMPASKRYMQSVVALLAVLFPLALITNAVIGLCGYVELAFAISQYQALFLIVMVGYSIVRGILIDLVDYTSEFLIRTTPSGWVLTEAIMKPLDRILRLVLGLGSAILLIHLYELDKSPAFLSSVYNFFHFKLFDFGGNVITLLVLMKAFLIGVVLFWLSRWSREFSFRRLYVKARDAGVRNSLSIFTQYGVVILGVLLGLKIIGLDLGGFAVVAAAFAAGLGFGLRDLANNFFSGILLLVERPFRTGDIVTLGEYEGEVVHTGLRSMMIRTWDRMEVIVPNADMFTKPFTNWTHQDSIVRTVINIKIHRSDDPHRVKQVIIDVLAKIKAVVDNPAVEVFMQEMNDSLVEMQVRYYVVLSPLQARAKVRSEVLFALWDAFKTHNIHPPYPQFDVRLETPSAS